MHRLKLICILSVCATSLLVAGCQSAPNSDAAAARSAAKDAPPAPPVEQSREITIPTGTAFTVAIDDTVGSATSHVDDPVHAHLTRPVSIDGAVTVPTGSSLTGAVVAAVRSGRVKGRAQVAVRFEMLSPKSDAETYTIRTAQITRTAQGEKKKDAVKIGAGAGAGAAIGALLGGGKGAAIGAGVGGGAGTAYVMSERGQEISIVRGSTLVVKLTEPLKVRVSASTPAVASARVN